ncbi:hypothetical protein CsSME_00049607 [Camellia sinensis var. sinensis]
MFNSEIGTWVNCFCNLLGIGSFSSSPFTAHWKDCRVPLRCHVDGSFPSYNTRASICCH